MATNGDLDGELQLLLRASDKLHPAIIEKIQNSSLFPPPLSYRGRVKHEARVREKIERKRRLRPNYGIKQVTDLIGIRFITLMRMGIADVTDAILDLLTEPAGRELGDFGSARLLEFKQYISPPPQDIDPDTGEWLDSLRDQLEAQLSNHFPDGPPVAFQHEIRAQYSGVHMVVAFPMELDGHKLVVPVEFQVRSVFEEAWGELDHLLFYEADRAGLVTGERRRLAASRHLGILKSMLDTAARYAELISQTDTSGTDAPKPDIRPNLDGVDYAKTLAAPITDRREIIDEFLGLVQEKRNIDLDRTSNDEYLGLASKFKELFEKEFSKIEPEDFPGDQPKRIRSLAFLMLMEQAISLFLGARESPVREAIALYEDITSKTLFPGLHGKDFPTAWFRMGEAKAWMMELSADGGHRDQLAAEAFAAYAKARKTLSAVPENETFIIAPDQRAYLDENIERLQGFALWRVSDMRRGALEGRAQLIDLQNVRDAWKVVEKRATALRRPFSWEGLNLYNTATYFAADGVRLCEILGQPVTGFPPTEAIEAMLDTLHEEMKAQAYKDEKFSHTIMCGALLLGDAERAARAADDVMAAHVAADTTHFSPYQKDMHDRVAREAWAVLRPGALPGATPGD